jgi:amino acid adenylation domain-containing protein
LVLIIKKFEEIVDKYPGNTAVKTNTVTFTYRQLDACANRAAKEIAGIDTQILKQRPQVALLFEHGAGVIAAILAALKAGRTYVPLDAAYPLKRLAYMLEHSLCGVILTDDENAETAARLAAQLPGDPPTAVINTDTLDDWRNCLERPSRLSNGQDKPAYILYTSGSTGKPKGVMQTQKNIMYFTRQWIRHFDIRQSSRLSLLTSFSHDQSVQDVFSALLSGACLFPFYVKQETHVYGLYNSLLTEKVTHWHSVPTLFRFFTNTFTQKDRFPDLAHLILGGEAVREHDLAMARTYFPNAAFSVIYGQTESSVNSICHLSPGDSFKKVTSGEPMEDTRILLVDEEGNEAGEMGVGEIVVAGGHLSPGYWRDQDMTDDAFDLDDELGRLYWTGDMGRRTANGQIKLTGRKDNQVKIRGFRVELGEIESTMMQLDAVTEAAVLIHEQENNQHLICAYYTASQPLGQTLLREYLEKRLPDYMAPAYFMLMDKMPLTSSGKIDRRQLPEPGQTGKTQYEPPRDEIEKKLVRIWEDVLEVKQVGINDNFIDLGGHSLMVITIITRIHQEMQVELNLNDVFDNPTVYRLAQVIRDAAAPAVTRTAADLLPAEEKHFYPTSSAQKRLFIWQQKYPGHINYNMVRALILEGNVDEKRLEATFVKLTERHEPLRTSFHLHADEVVQTVHPSRDIPFKMKPLQCEYSQSRIDEEIKRFVRPFDLSAAPLFRVSWIRFPDKEDINYLLFDIHHIIFDQISLQLFSSDFGAFYNGGRPGPLTVQYKDYVEWQQQHFNRARFNENEEYWLKQMKAFTFTRIPADNISAYKNMQGRMESGVISGEDYERLGTYCMSRRITRFTFLISLLAIVLAGETGQDDITVGAPVSLREHPKLQHVLGMFLNVVLIRSNLDKDANFQDFLEANKKTVLDGLERSSYPFESLAAKLKEQGDARQEDLFSVLFNYTPQPEPRKEPGGNGGGEIAISTYIARGGTPRFDITFYAMEGNQKIDLLIDYKSNIYYPQTIKDFLNRFTNALNMVLDDETVTIRQLIRQQPPEEPDEFATAMEEQDFLS